MQNPRLNIGIVIPFLEKYGGAERYLIECVAHWQYKHDITIYAVSINKDLLQEHGVTALVQLKELTPYFEGEHAMLLNAILLPKIWRDEIAYHDVYHTHLWPTHLIDKHPMVWFPHEPLRVLHDLRFEQGIDFKGDDDNREVHVYPKYHYDHIHSNIYSSYLDIINVIDKTGRPERIVANSHFTASYLEDVYRVSIKEVVYPGIAQNLYDDVIHDHHLFVTISQLWSHKRIHLLIEAIALTENAKLMIIGSGPEHDHLQALIHKLELTDRVSIVSGLSNATLGALLSKACAFMFAAIREPFGIVVLEAMAAGKPIIAVDQGGFTEVCNNECAFLLSPIPSLFAEKIAYLQQHPEVGQRMGQVARQIAVHYTWKKTAFELEKILVNVTLATRKVPLRANSLDKQLPLFGIQYYAWYGEGYGSLHWNDHPKSGHVSDQPMFGFYGSSKGETINYHLSLIENMTLDFVILNLHVDEKAINPLELYSIQHIFEIAERRKSPLRFAIQIAPYVLQNIDHVLKAITLIQKLCIEKNNYFSMHGKPVLFWFWSSVLDGQHTIVDKLAKATSTFSNVAVGLRIPDEYHEKNLTYGWFDGFIPYSPLELAREANWERVWRMAYDHASAQGMTCLGVSVSPGYDDSGLQDPLRENNPYRVVDRRDGAVYQRGFRFVQSLKVKPNMVIISTFNEFHENTHIEPSLRHGDKYINMTAEFVKQCRLRWNQHFSSSQKDELVFQQV